MHQTDVRQSIVERIEARRGRLHLYETIDAARGPLHHACAALSDDEHSTTFENAIQQFADEMTSAEVCERLG